MIKINQVSKTFNEGNTYAVQNLSLDIAENELLVLLGSSGSGKSTLLRMINRLIEPSSGDIELDGQSIKSYDPIELRRSVGFVFQKAALFPHLNVFENIEMIPKLMGWSKTKRQERVRELMDLVHLDYERFAYRLPGELSGGQQQRVGVARALAIKPRYLLMDEPFGALDAITRDSLQQEIIEFKEKLGVTIIFVTHDIFEALALGDRIAVLHGGILQQIDSKEEILKNPKTQFVRDLFEKPAQQLQLLN